ncbi:MAG: aconitate hydratase AcnA [Calditrichota bacterium]
MSDTLTNSFGAKSVFDPKFGKSVWFRLAKLTEIGLADMDKLPFSIKVLLEAALRSENGCEVTRDDVERLARYNPAAPENREIPFNPARVLLQDFTGVPAVVDLAAMRAATARIGGDPERINPLIPVDLVIDHSISVDWFNRPDAFELNSKLEFERNRERYEFLSWGQKAFKNFRVIPPASGICHQVNLEYLGTVVQRRQVEGETVVFPDSLVGTDSHTPMINGLGVVGWGVGGIEAEAVMLGQPLSMLLPEVIGLRLIGELSSGVTATDLVLTITQLLRKKKVVGKFVEYFGAGLSAISVPDRATLANMSPENGSTMGFFPVDNRTLEFLRQTGRPAELIDLVERYCKDQGLFRTDATPAPQFKDVLELDLSTVEPSIAGPRRPHDRVNLPNQPSQWKLSLTNPTAQDGFGITPNQMAKTVPIEWPEGNRVELKHGDVVIAAITSCTNTSNPSVLIAAGLLAKKAAEAGLAVKPHVKTSLAPGSRAVTEYLDAAGLTPHLAKMGFYVAGYGCTTCIGNSGPVPDPVARAVEQEGLILTAVLSGNRNFTGRINPHTKASYLASPPLVVAYAIAGTMDIDLTSQPLGKGKDGRDVFLKDIWPSRQEIEDLLRYAQDPQTFLRGYDNIERRNEMWNRIQAPLGSLYQWAADSTYIQEPPFFMELKPEVEPIRPISGARALIKAGHSITTDHISPAGSIAKDSPAAKFLIANGVEPNDFNSYGSRRGNDRVMTRGTFGNIMFRNLLGQGKLGGWTTHFPSGELMTVYDASLRYQKDNVPLLVIAGNDYGMGSSRDWAAKGTLLLGIRVVIANSFERIHRSNLIGMGVLPLQFKEGEDQDTLKLTGAEQFDIAIGDDVKPGQEIIVQVTDPEGTRRSFQAICRLDSVVEVDYYRNGGILQTVLRRISQK